MRAVTNSEPVVVLCQPTCAGGQPAKADPRQTCAASKQVRIARDKCNVKPKPHIFCRGITSSTNYRYVLGTGVHTATGTQAGPVSQLFGRSLSVPQGCR